MVDQACGCEADSGDPDYSCDCAMQGHCICSADCKCATDVCKEAVGQMSYDSKLQSYFLFLN